MLKMPSETSESSEMGRHGALWKYCKRGKCSAIHLVPKVTWISTRTIQLHIAIRMQGRKPYICLHVHNGFCRRVMYRSIVKNTLAQVGSSPTERLCARACLTHEPNHLYQLPRFCHSVLGFALSFRSLRGLEVCTANHGPSSHL